jgi:nondiscriminating glutamyl-tRNA synthetase
VLEKAKDRELSAQSIKEIAKEVQKELNVKAKDVWSSLRIALTGQLEGVGVDIICDTLPKERVLKRIEHLLQKIV